MGRFIQYILHIGNNKKREKGDNNMTQEQFAQLERIYNTLKMISTKGEDTLVMADCLRAIESLAQEIEIIERETEEK